MSKYYSVSTIKEPEFLNITPYNPLISKCEIKVLYLGNNDNGTNIERATAEKMANSLPGSPIVGAYNKSKEDFGDHGDVIIMEDGEIKTSCKTVPYGFVAPDAKIWFKEFEEENRKGEIVKRTYLMTEGYLWTGQYEEAKRVIEKGNGQSMELNKNSVDGSWTKDENGDYSFFIINDAIFSKLCILGENVEPCFEGASITAPDISKKYTTINKDFSQTLYSMLNELKFSLQGGQKMEENTIQNSAIDENSSLESNEAIDFEKKEEEKENNTEEPKEEEKKEKKYSLDDIVEYQELLQKYQTLEQENEKLKESNEQLTQFKLSVEKDKKQQMIDSFYMLSDDDKKDVIDNINNYSLDEIEAKLSIICVRNKVNFNLDDNSKNENNLESELVYSLNTDAEDSFTPAWIKAIKDRRKDQ